MLSCSAVTACTCTLDKSPIIQPNHSATKPRVLWSLLLQVSFLVQTCQMLVNMKRKELMYKARQRRAAAAVAADQNGVVDAKKVR